MCLVYQLFLSTLLTFSKQSIWRLSRQQITKTRLVLTMTQMKSSDSEKQGTFTYAITNKLTINWLSTSSLSSNVDNQSKGKNYVKSTNGIKIDFLEMNDCKRAGLFIKYAA